MTTERNMLRVPEISAYSREAIEGGVVVRYLVRGPGERDWRPVKLFRPTDPDPEAPVPCVLCGTTWPARTMSDGICIPCVYGGTD